MARLLPATLDFTPQPSLEIELLPWRHYLQLLWRYLQFSWNARSSFGEWKGCMGSEWGRVVWSWSQYLISIGLCSVQRWTSIMSEWSKYFQAAFIVNIVSHSWKTGVKISQNIFLQQISIIWFFVNVIGRKPSFLEIYVHSGVFLFIFKCCWELSQHQKSI